MSYENLSTNSSDGSKAIDGTDKLGNRNRDLSKDVVIHTTKHCPKCGTERLLLLRTCNLKICVDCHISIPWYLGAGQSPLF
jgi:hypothetical protein